MSLAEPRWTKREVEEALRLRAAGFSDIAIGASIGRTASSVYGKLYRVNNPERAARYQARSYQATREIRDKALPGATRRGQPWTSWELELVSEASEGELLEVCELLGRTYMGVVAKRHLLRIGKES